MGSLGDLYPYLAIGRELKARGHKPIIGTYGHFHQKVAAAGLGFQAIRPDPAEFRVQHELTKRASNPRNGTEYLIRKMFLSNLRDSYQDLSQAVKGVDLLLTNPLTYAGPLVAQKSGVKWVSSVVQPMTFYSAYDPPVLSSAPVLTKLRHLGPGVYSALFRLVRWRAQSLAMPITRLRGEIGLLPSKAHPMFEGQFSPAMTLALFSKMFAAPQPDWPPNTVVTGFPFYDQGSAEIQVLSYLKSFIKDGEPPIIFCLGSSEYDNARDFFRHSLDAVRQLRKRAVFVLGNHPQSMLPRPYPEGVVAFNYIPFSQLFCHASAIVHHGGIGTIASALRAGRQMLIVPFTHDMPDNAERAWRLGVAEIIPRSRYNAHNVVEALQLLLRNNSYAAKAVELSRTMQAEDGIKTACDALESCLN